MDENTDIIYKVICITTLQVSKEYAVIFHISVYNFSALFLNLNFKYSSSMRVIDCSTKECWSCLLHKRR
jgi:hypothetical protein